MYYYKYYDKILRMVGVSISDYSYNRAKILYYGMNNYTKECLVECWKLDDDNGDMIAGPEFSLSIHKLMNIYNINLNGLYEEWSYEAGIRDCILSDGLYVLE